MLVLSLPAFENKKYTAYDRFHGNGPYGEIPTEKEPIRTLGFTLPYNNVRYFSLRRIYGYFCHSRIFLSAFFHPHFVIPILLSAIRSHSVRTQFTETHPGGGGGGLKQLN